MNCHLQKLTPLRKTNGIVAPLKVSVVFDFITNLLHLIINVNEVSTFDILERQMLVNDNSKTLDSDVHALKFYLPRI